MLTTSAQVQVQSEGGRSHKSINLTNSTHCTEPTPLVWLTFHPPTSIPTPTDHSRFHPQPGNKVHWIGPPHAYVLFGWNTHSMNSRYLCTVSCDLHNHGINLASRGMRMPQHCTHSYEYTLRTQYISYGAPQVKYSSLLNKKHEQSMFTTCIPIQTCATA